MIWSLFIYWYWITEYKWSALHPSCIQALTEPPTPDSSLKLEGELNTVFAQFKPPISPSPSTPHEVRRRLRTVNPTSQLWWHPRGCGKSLLGPTGRDAHQAVQPLSDLCHHSHLSEGLHHYSHPPPPHKKWHRQPHYLQHHSPRVCSHEAFVA